MGAGVVGIGVFRIQGSPLKKPSRTMRPAKIPGGRGNGGIEGGGVPSQISRDRCWFRFSGKEIHSLKTLK